VPQAGEGEYLRVLSLLGAETEEEKQALAELRESARELKRGEGYLAFAKVCSLIRVSATETLKKSREPWEISKAQGRIETIEELRDTLEFLVREEKEEEDGG
jgi:hypothetical protein